MSNASKRKVVTEAEILEYPCCTCGASVGKTCSNMPIHDLRYPLVVDLVNEQSELSFHKARIKCAKDHQVTQKLGSKLSVIEKDLITYYAFIMLCDSVASKSMEMIGKHLTSEEIQMFFINMAVVELKNDKML